MSLVHKTLKKKPQGNNFIITINSEFDISFTPSPEIHIFLSLSSGQTDSVEGDILFWACGFYLGCFQ